MKQLNSLDSYNVVFLKIFANTDKFLVSIQSNFLSCKLENTLRDRIVKGIIQNKLMYTTPGFFSLWFLGDFNCVAYNAGVMRAIQQ